MIKLAATIGDLCNIDVNSCGDLLSRFEEYVGKIVKIIPHNLETDKIEYGQLISTRNNVCKFKRKDRTTFKIDEQDIKIIEILKSPNYKGGNSSKYGEFLYKIVMVYPHNTEVDKTELARLIKISNNKLTFERKNGEKFTLDERDIEHMDLFRSPNYKGGI